MDVRVVGAEPAGLEELLYRSAEVPGVVLRVPATHVSEREVPAERFHLDVEDPDLHDSPPSVAPI